MHSELIQQIQDRLQQANALIQSTPVPNDYPTLQTKIFQLELEQEVNFLLELLQQPNTFEQGFVIRCAEREQGLHNGMPLAIAPQSLTAKLYWDIALIVFEPNTLGKMLHYIAPELKHYLEIDIPDPPKNITKEHIKHYYKSFSPLITEPEPILNKLTQPADFEELDKFIFDNKELLDIRNIANYPLRPHIKLKEALTKTYPKLAEKLFQRNLSLKNLATDIQYYIGEKTNLPIDALNDLIFGLEYSGTKITGNLYANERANTAIKNFFIYFNYLPKDLQDRIRALNNAQYSFGLIFDTQISKGRCVEEGSFHLKSVRDRNIYDPVLFSSPIMNAEQLQKFELKYHYHASTNEPVLDIRKEIPPIDALPPHWLQKAILTIKPQTQENLVYLILYFHPDYYDMLWQHMVFENSEITFANLGTLLKLGFFTEVQKQSLAKAIAKHYERFSLKNSFLHWSSFSTKNLIFILQALNDIPYEQRFDRASNTIHFDRTLLFSLVKNPEGLEAFLNLFPPDKRLELVRYPRNNNPSLVYVACSYPRSATLVLQLYPIYERFSELTKKNRFNKIAILNAVENPEVLNAVIKLLRRYDARRAVQITDKNYITPLHNAYKIESATIILNQIPINNRYHALTRQNYYGMNPLHLYYSQPKYIETILQLVPPNQRLALLTTDNIHSRSVIQLFMSIQGHELSSIIKLLPKHDKLNLMEFLLRPERAHRISNTAIINLFPELMRNLSAIKLIVYGQTPLHYKITALHQRGSSLLKVDYNRAIKIQSTATNLNNRLNNFYINLLEHPKTQAEITLFFETLKRSIEQYNPNNVHAIKHGAYPQSFFQKINNQQPAQANTNQKTVRRFY